MTTTTIRLAAALAVLCACAPCFAADSLSDRIARIESGLKPGAIIKGRPVPVSRIEARMNALGVPGVSVAVINHGAIEWARGYGVVESGGKRKVSTSTMFQAASISKPVAALGALHLVEQGKLSLDEDINNKLTAWKVPSGAQTADAPVTIRNLLNHSAGTTVHGFRGYAANEPVPTLLNLLDGAKPANSDPVRVVTKPGEQWKYSGGGISIAQLAMTSVAGKPFTQLMADIVLKPLGMTHSTFAQPLPASLRAAAATGHDNSGRPLKGKWHTYPEQAAAGLWTTPSDLARFAIELQQASAGKSNKVISQAMAAQMLTRLKGSYGLGIEVDEVDGQPSFSHGGSNEGYRASLYALTKDGQGAVVMTNGDRGNELAGDIMRSIAAEYKWKEWQVVEKPLAPVSAATLAHYAGSYQLGPMKISVTQNGDRLFIAAPPLGPDPLEIFPSSETAFFNLRNGMEFAFEANQAGKFDLIIKADEPRRATRVL